MKKVKLDITVEGDLSDFLGVSIDRLPNGSYHLSQPKLIDSILDDLRLSGDNVVAKSTPMSSSKLLSRHLDSAPHDNSFHYRRAIGKLNFLEKSTRPDIAYAVHQCARFSIDPKVEHANAVHWIARYLKEYGTRDSLFIPLRRAWRCLWTQISLGTGMQPLPTLTRTLHAQDIATL